ncbi:hypothetical protein GALL_545810 [mine drainage metagenome]|uniref:Uncharacterized protein n=1 Tax=mine drainage metagenome TaxID=410659 RepID=A0A1J5PF46_9ZZZZ
MPAVAVPDAWIVVFMESERNWAGAAVRTTTVAESEFAVPALFAAWST